MIHLTDQAWAVAVASVPGVWSCVRQVIIRRQTRRELTKMRKRDEEQQQQIDSANAICKRQQLEINDAKSQGLRQDLIISQFWIVLGRMRIRLRQMGEKTGMSHTEIDDAEKSDMEGLPAFTGPAKQP